MYCGRDWRRFLRCVFAEISAKRTVAFYEGPSAGSLPCRATEGKRTLGRNLGKHTAGEASPIPLGELPRHCILCAVARSAPCGVVGCLVTSEVKAVSHDGFSWCHFVFLAPAFRRATQLKCHHLCKLFRGTVFHRFGFIECNRCEY